MPTPRKPDRPIFWIVAGPNGSGKSTFYNRTDIEGWGGSVWIINPDLLTATIVEHEQLSVHEANLAAVKRIGTWLEASIDAYQTIGVETVLSSGKYRRLVTKAANHGFDVRMIYILLANGDLQLSRIRQRVRDGGHDVPPEKALQRRDRSFVQLSWFVRNVHTCYIFDNSSGSPDLIGIANKGSLYGWSDWPADLMTVLAREGVERLKFD